MAQRFGEVLPYMRPATNGRVDSVGSDSHQTETCFHFRTNILQAGKNLNGCRPLRTHTHRHKRDRPQWRSCLGRRCPHRPHSIFIKPVLSSPMFQQPHPKKMIRTAPLRPSVRFLWKRSAKGLKARTFISASWRKAEAPIPRAPIENGGLRAETPSPVLWSQRDRNATHQSGVSSEPLRKA